MEIDKDKLVDWLISIFNDVEHVEKELLAHRAMFAMLKASGAFSDFDQILEAARKNASLALDQKYVDIRAAISKLLTQADFDQASAKYLREWKPKGQAN
jgi:hypothetical protein